MSDVRLKDVGVLVKVKEKISIITQESEKSRESILGSIKKTSARAEIKLVKWLKIMKLRYNEYLQAKAAYNACTRRQHLAENGRLVPCCDAELISYNKALHKYKEACENVKKIQNIKSSINALYESYVKTTGSIVGEMKAISDRSSLYINKQKDILNLYLDSSERSESMSNLKKDVNARQVRGMIREQKVADMTGGKVSNKNIKSTAGGTDIDVIGPNGELIMVGGPAKAKDLAKLGTVIKVYQDEAAERGVQVKAYFSEETPQKVIDFAIKKLGKDSVVIFED